MVEVIDGVSVFTGVICFIILCWGLFWCGRKLAEHSKSFSDLAPVMYALSLVCFTLIFTLAVSPWIPDLGRLLRLANRVPVYIATGVLLRFIYLYRNKRIE